MNERDPQTRLSRISTRWDLLAEAHRGQGNAVSEAQRLLMRRYCGAVYRYLLAAVRDPDAADELSQEFALRFVRGDFKRADPDKGRFRDFVKTALYHLIVDHRRRQQARPVPLPEGSFDLPAPGTAEAPSDQEFVAHWRQELLDRTWEALAELERQTGQTFHTVLRWRAENPEAPAAQLAERLTREGGRPFTDAGVRQTLHRAREKFADLLLEEVARSLGVSEAERVQEELTDLGLLPYCRPALDRRGGKVG
jgi:RNA polymerase sigma-70 factor (ECF subfamily)